MSQEDAADGSGPSENSKLQISQSTFSSVVTSVFEDTMYNIIHDVVLQTHRSEKLLRMQSAATQVSMAASSSQLQSPHPSSETPTKPSNSLPTPTTAKIGKVETPGATYNDGLITLKGNPLRSTPQIYCPQCRLPRLLYPLSGVGAQMPDDLNAQYCTRHPFVSKSGHDVYGMPFPTDQAKTKKERELIKQQARAEKDSTPASQNSDPQGGTQDSESVQVQNGINKLQPQSKGANYIPWHTCPRCKRSLLITRFAQHLEKCLGISGRQSSRNAMAKLSGQNGSMGSTPMGSRPGTPGPGNQGEAKGQKRDRDDDDGDELEDIPLKKVKKRQYVKKADRERLAAQSSSETLANSQSQEKLEKDKDKNKDKDKDKSVDKERIVLKMKPSQTSVPTTKEGTPAKRPPKPGGQNGSKVKPENGKRERESDKDDDAENTPKKKQKVSDEASSTAS
ncbi:hypothetical protein NA57DRAFT_57147 [Rhizodiscina lignyota]|uniref:SAGA-associated factor 11 n=1 Tax=Rhizodiscina lignyota TaxID=1504668 RepID=A0A9P4M5L3_9PEZI|nr:hypothetical protein NA57DRAFT_57147 [Rhizodiscina lignyota]